MVCGGPATSAHGLDFMDANGDAHLWAESYDRELTAANIFAIKSEVAAAIAGALKATLSGRTQAPESIPDENLEAWEAYPLGKQRMAGARPRRWPTRKDSSSKRSIATRISRSPMLAWRTRSCCRRATVAPSSRR